MNFASLSRLKIPPFIGVVMEESVSGMSFTSIVNPHLRIGQIISVHVGQLTAQLTYPKEILDKYNSFSILAQVVWLKIVDPQVIKVGLQFVSGPPHPRG